MDKLLSDIGKMIEAQNFNDMDEVNKFLNDFMASGAPVPGWEPSTLLQQAQDFMYQAWETQSRTKRINLARKALQTSADCADAYILLGRENTKTVPEMRAFFEEAVRAGKRGLGDEFEEYRGSFWGVLETRPYMRALLELAMVLDISGETERSVEIMQEMLDLNPNDNQGVRMILISHLLYLQDHMGAEALLKKYPNDSSAAMRYSKALHLFHKHGSGAKSETALRAAFKTNPHVPRLLLNPDLMTEVPDSPYYSPGDIHEAVDYVEGGLFAWGMSEEALAWLEESARNAGLEI